MMNAINLPNSTTSFYAGANPERVYGLGSGTSVDIRILQSNTTRSTRLTPSTSPTSSRTSLGTVLYSSKTVEYRQVIVGQMSVVDQWSKGNWSDDIQWEAGEEWQVHYMITPNDYNFPSGGLTTGPNLPENDLVAMMIGLYASAPGNLCTYDNEVTKGIRVAQIATTIASPGHGYQGTYNYFDPDNFIALSSVLYTGDSYLQKQARDVIMRSGAYLNKTTGQLPHHFVNDKPTYLALSGATQTGPNIFWTKTAIRYAAISGDIEWLESYLLTLRNASNFCFDLINNDVHLINAPGSLMIDVFIRGNYTSDSNGMMVSFLKDFAKVERAVGSKSIAASLDKKSELMASAMNKWLWDASGDNDHYVTQIDPDLKTIRDFVDYDANLIAAASGVPSRERATALLARIDRGTCSANGGGGPQWVSERYYGPNDTTHGNIGDSRCSMGRIAWFDAHARKIDRTKGSLLQFNSNLLTLQNDLVRDTWLHERYGCDGKQQQNRTMYYFEYPSTVVMLLREIRYGINLNLATVEIDPFGPSSFTYNIGNVYVKYNAPGGMVEINVPGSRKVSYEVHGMEANALYDIVIDGKSSETATADGSGLLVFSGLTGCLVQATKH